MPIDQYRLLLLSQKVMGLTGPGGRQGTKNTENILLFVDARSS